MPFVHLCSFHIHSYQLLREYCDFNRFLLSLQLENVYLTRLNFDKKYV